MKKVRHILGISGGKDSTGLAILLHRIIPDLEFFFCDTHKELPETYEYLQRIQTRFGIKINMLSSNKGFDEWLDLYSGYLPSARARWCTRRMKLEPLSEFVGDDVAYSYVGIREDEDRAGYLGSNPDIKPVYVYKARDFRQRNLGKEIYNQKSMLAEFKKIGIELPVKECGYRIDDVLDLVEKSGLGIPKYYDWRTRSGCFFCFFQRKYEWVMLSEKHPKLFEEAAKYEKTLKSGRKFTWCAKESLGELLDRKDQIIANHKKSLTRKKKEEPNRPLSEVLASVLDDDDFDKPCLVCSL